MIEITYFGSGDFGLPVLEAICKRTDMKLKTVITQGSRSGKNNESNTAVGKWATGNNIKTIIIGSLISEEGREIVNNNISDLMLVADFGLIIPQEILGTAPSKWINIHGSCLPKYRGASPIQAAIFNGEKESGITYIVMDAGVDTGPVIAEMAVGINSNETAIGLRKTLSQLAADNLDVLVKYANHEIDTKKQNNDEATYVKRLTKDDGKCRWNSANEEERRIRAYSPWPGAWGIWKGKVCKIISAKVIEKDDAAKPGTIISLAEKNNWGVVCKHGILIPELMQMEGKKPQEAKNFPGGYPGFIGSEFN